MNKKPNAASTVPVVVRLPKKVIQSLDKAASENCRTRSSEVRSRLVKSLATRVRA